MKKKDKNLCRVHLAITVTDSQLQEGADTPALQHSFIYGVDSAGLTPFEVFLADMELGDAKEITLANRDVQPFLGCLFTRLRQHSKLLGTAEQVQLVVVLEGYEPAEPREIVQSMARSVGEGGCSGGCGCGCG